MTTVGYATLQIIPSAKGMLGNLSKEVGEPLEKAGKDGGEKSAKAFGTSFKKIVLSLGLAKVATEAFGFAKESIGAASDLDESMTKVETVFGDASASVLKWSETSATAFGQSRQQALEAAGTYGNLFQAFGIGLKPAEEMSTSLVELAADLASFNNTSVDDALLALRSGLSGETEPLKRFGVAINDARLKQVAFEMGLISSVKEGLDPAAKAQAAYALIMQDTAIAQGDFARTSDGLANRQRILSARFDNLKAKLGTALLPAVTAVAGVLADKVIPAVEKLAATWLPRLSSAFQSAGSVVMDALGVIRDVVTWLADNEAVFFGIAAAVAAALVPALVAWTTATWAQVTALWAQAAAFAAAHAPMVAIAAAIGALVAGVIYAYQEWDWFRNTVNKVRDFLVDKLWPALKTIAAFIVDDLVPALVSAYGWFKDNILPIFQAVASFIVDRLVPAIADMWRWFNDNVIPVLGVIVGLIRDYVVVQFTALWTVISTVAGWLQTAWEKSETLRGLLAGAFLTAVDVIRGAFDLTWQAVEKLAGWLQTAWDKTEPLRELFAGAFKLAVDAVTSAFGAAVTVISTLVGWIDSAISKAKTLINLIPKMDIPGVTLNPFSDKDWEKILSDQGRIPGKAMGGHVFAGRPYIVGEDGWEFFVPSTNGMILSHQASMRAVAGGSTQPVSGGSRTGVNIEHAEFHSGADVDEVMRVANFHLAAAG